LTIQPGDILEVYENEDDWWFGNIQGQARTGFFPSNVSSIPTKVIWKETKKLTNKF
jgi:uncharacterized protein YqfB (UPF0267 family)